MRKFEVVDATGSTNSDLLERPFVALSPVPQQQLSLGSNQQVLLAWQQQAGRGQRGRQWQSNIQQSLTFSMSIDCPIASIALEGFSLFVGLCVVEGIEQWWQQLNTSLEAPKLLEHVALPSLQLKWPNDIVVRNVGPNQQSKLSKISGVLIETKTQAQQIRIVVGVGVNVFGELRSDDDLAIAAKPEGQLSALKAAYLATDCWVLHSSATEVSKNLRESLARQISSVFFGHWPVFANRGFSAYQKAYQEQHVLHNQSVQWLDDGRWYVGHCLGVADDGSLRVRRADGIEQQLYSSSVSVRLASV